VQVITKDAAGLWSLGMSHCICEKVFRDILQEGHLYIHQDEGDIFFQYISYHPAKQDHILKDQNHPFTPLWEPQISQKLC
jgi:hypothetical protein